MGLWSLKMRLDDCRGDRPLIEADSLSYRLRRQFEALHARSTNNKQQITNNTKSSDIQAGDELSQLEKPQAVVSN